MLLMLSQWLQGLSPEFGFFRVFQYLTFRAVMAAMTALLIGLVVLFHFDTGLALRAYAIGTLLACAAAVALGAGDALLSKSVLQQLPIHWFTIAVLSVAKISREVLAQEKLAGMGAGLATVAHELRTPLTSVDANVRGLLRMMSNAQVSQQDDRLSIIDALARIQFEVRHMNHMIDLFLLSATAVRQNLHPVETVSMESVVQAVLKRYPFSSQKQQKSVQLELRHNFHFPGQTELAVVVLLNQPFALAGSLTQLTKGELTAGFPPKIAVPPAQNDTSLPALAKGLGKE